MDVYPAYEDTCIRILLFGNEVDQINRFDPISGEIKEELDVVVIFPAKDFITDKENILVTNSFINRDLVNLLNS